MTTGERIAQKRKELGLSQEALGERLHVSRQSIYKWESNAALPEIEKLVGLSREFGVSVGWLLGEEDGGERPELTPEQLRMVEEIVGRYLDARPAPEPDPAPEPEEPKQPEVQHKKPWVRVLALTLIALVVFVSFTSALEQLRQENHALQAAIGSVRYDVNSQINDIARRVESILQSQNALVAEQSASVAGIDCATNTVTVSARAVPRTYVEGMTAEFTLTSGGETVSVPVLPGADHAFQAEVTGPLSDEVVVSVAFVTGEKRETQALERFDRLFSESFPKLYVDVEASILLRSGPNLGGYFPVELGTAGGCQVRVGLFRDNALLTWLQSCERPEDYRHFEGYSFYRLEEGWTMEPGHVYAVAVVLTDPYGRERVYSSAAVTYEKGEGDVSFISTDYGVQMSPYPADWEY